MNRYLQREGRTVTRDLTAGLTATIIVAVLLTTAISFWVRSSQMQAAMSNQAHRTIDNLASVLALPLWQLDNRAATLAAEAYLHAGNVVGIRVLNDDNSVVFDTGMNRRGHSQELLQRILYKGNYVGSVTILVSGAAMRNERAHLVFFVVLMGASVVAAVALMNRLLLHRLLIRPIGHIGNGLATLAAGKYGYRLDPTGRCDLDEIVFQVNAMAAQIAERDDRLRQLVLALEKRVAERMQAEEALRESKQRYENLANLLPEAVFETDERRQITFLNLAGFKSLGFTGADLLGGIDLLQIVEPEERKRAAENVRRILSRAEVEPNEYRIRRQDGTSFPALAHSSCIVKDNEVRGLRGVVIDISKRKEMERQLEERLRFETILSQLSARFVSLHARAIDTEVEAGIREIATFLGVDLCNLLETNEDSREFRITHSYVGPRCGDEQPKSLGEKSPAHLETARRGEIVRWASAEEITDSDAGGQTQGEGEDCKSHLVIPLAIGGEVLGAIEMGSLQAGRSWPDILVQRLQLIGEVFSNAVARKHAEEALWRNREELAHVSRVAMMGELMASIAHELNQPLAAILRNAEAGVRYMRADRPPLEEIADILKDIVGADKRAGDVIRRLRSFLRKEQFDRVPLDLNEVVRKAVMFVRNELEAKKISLQIVLADDLEPAFGDSIQLQQLVLNLLINGIEAIAANSDAAGPLEMAVKTFECGTGWVGVSLRDSGVGAEEEAIRRMFDPFFSTKAEGMGMGLAISRSIIEMHGGKIWAERNADNGLTLHFVVPTSDSPEAHA